MKRLKNFVIVFMLLTMMCLNIGYAINIQIPDITTTSIGQLPNGFIRVNSKGQLFNTGSDSNFNYFTVVDGDNFGFPGVKVLQSNTFDKVNLAATSNSVMNSNIVTAGEYSYGDITVTGKFSIQNKMANVVVRHSQNGTFYSIQFNSQRNEVSVYKHQNVYSKTKVKTVPILQAGLPSKIITNTSYDYKIVVSNNTDNTVNIKVYLFDISSNVVMDYTDTIKPIISGKYGFLVGPGEKSCYSNLAVSLGSSVNYSYIKIANGDINLRKGDNVQLKTLGVLPNGDVDDITNIVTYSSNNTNVLVSDRGLVGVNPLNTTFPITTSITATYFNTATTANNKSSTITIHVKDLATPTSIDFSSCSSVSSALSLFNVKNYNKYSNTYGSYLYYETDLQSGVVSPVNVLKLSTVKNNTKDIVLYRGNCNLYSKFNNDVMGQATAKFRKGGTYGLLLHYDPQFNSYYKVSISEQGIYVYKFINGLSVDKCTISKDVLKPGIYYNLSCLVEKPEVASSGSAVLKIYLDGKYIGLYNDFSYSAQGNFITMKDVVSNTSYTKSAGADKIYNLLPNKDYTYTYSVTGIPGQKGILYIEEFVNNKWVAKEKRPLLFNGAAQVETSKFKTGLKSRMRFSQNFGDSVTYTINFLEYGIPYKGTVINNISSETILQTISNTLKNGYYHYTFESRGSGVILIEKATGGTWYTVATISAYNTSKYQKYQGSFYNSDNSKYRIRIPSGMQVRNCGVFEPLTTGYIGVTTNSTGENEVYIKDFKSLQE